jgi:acetyl-CoA carboxylase carboxyltransferase component
MFAPQKPLISKPFTDEQLENKKQNQFYNQKINSILSTSMKYSNKKSWEINTDTLKNQKYSTRQRIDMILDSDSFFLELSQLAGHEMYEQGNHHKIRFMAGVCSQVLERFQGNWL